MEPGFEFSEVPTLSVSKGREPYRLIKSQVFEMAFNANLKL
jgi:hypothetical protein